MKLSRQRNQYFDTFYSRERRRDKGTLSILYVLPDEHFQYLFLFSAVAFSVGSALQLILTTSVRLSDASLRSNLSRILTSPE